MDAAQVVVTVAGLAGIVGVLLFFFGPKKTRQAKHGSTVRL
jgi:hypothetical protein